MTMTRRKFMTHACAGTAMLSPVMQSVMAAIKARAAGDDNHPLRFVFLIKSNGLWAENIQPKNLLDRLPFKLEYDASGSLPNNDRARSDPTPAASIPLGDDMELCDVMKSMEPFRKRLSIIQGIDAGFSVYHNGGYRVLSGIAGRVMDSSEVTGVTIDALLARAFPAPMPHVCLGHDPKAASGISYIELSALDKDKPVPFYTKPRRAYADLFGVVGKGEAKNAYDAQSDILDFFAEDARRLQSEIAGPEREQMDQYLGAFDSIRKSRKQIEAMADKLSKHAPPAFDEIPAEEATRVNEANFDIAAASLISGLTNVVTIAYDTLGGSSYPALKVGSLHGAVGHGQGGDVLGKRQRIDTFQFTQIAKLAARLDAVSEGDGTMLDNTVIIYTSDNGETHHSQGKNWPMVILGDLGGRLAKRRYFAPGNDPSDKTKSKFIRLGDVWSTLLAAAGQSYEKFGIPTNSVAYKPIESLLA